MKEDTEETTELARNETRPEKTSAMPEQAPGQPPVNLHEIGLTRPADVERMESEKGFEALRKSMVKTNEDQLGSAASIIPTEMKEAEIDPEAMTDSTDKIQPVTDTNPAAHEAGANTGRDEAPENAKIADTGEEAAAKEKSKAPADEAATADDSEAAKKKPSKKTPAAAKKGVKK